MKLSIIVVTWNNEDYIQQAISSCIDKSVSDYEVIIVHNASTDNTGSLLHRSIKGNETLFKVIENPHNVGLGEARNIGMRFASGKYITFLDGDDWYEDGAVKLLVQLSSQNETDLYIYGYQRHYPHGELKPPHNKHILELGDVSSPERRKLVLSLFGVAWNKLYKRSYLKEINAKFDTGYYEDIDWNFKTLTQAKKVQAINENLVFYRQRDGSILRTTSEEHFDAIKRGKQLINFLKDNPEINATYGTSIWHYISGQCLGVVSMPNRLPQNRKSFYLKEASKMLAELRKLNNIKPSLREKIAATGSPLIWRLSIKVRDQLKRVQYYFKKIDKKIKNKGAQYCYSFFACTFPIDNQKVFYDSYWGKKADCNPLAIFNHLKEHKKLKHIWHLAPGVECPEDANVTYPRSLSSIYHMATAKYVISNVNLPNFFIKRSGVITLQTHHGTPLKYMGIDIRKKRPKEMDWLLFKKRTSQWTYMISSNEYSSKIWRQCMPYGAKILEIGYPRNDVFFKNNETFIQNLKNSFNIPLDAKVALYAPTFRDGKRKSASTDDDNSLYNKMLSALGETYYLLIREHYFNSISNHVSKKIINVSEYPHTNNLLLIADILITDYSSIMFDYACLKRPIILYAPDIEEYTTQRGMYFDIIKNAPGPVARNTEELEQVLTTHIYENKNNTKRRINFYNTYCIWDDGGAAKRAVDFLLNTQP